MIGEYIRTRRERKALSQAQLASLAGLSTSALIRIERGQARARLGTLRKLADALHLDIGELTTLWLDGTEAEEDERNPIETMAELGTSGPALATLRFGEAIQRVADDVLAGLVSGVPGTKDLLGGLVETARSLQGPVRVQGYALASFLSAIRDEVDGATSPPDVEATLRKARELADSTGEASRWKT